MGGFWIELSPIMNLSEFFRSAKSSHVGFLFGSSILIILPFDDWQEHCCSSQPGQVSFRHWALVHYPQQSSRYSQGIIQTVCGCVLGQNHHEITLELSAIIKMLILMNVWGLSMIFSISRVYFLFGRKICIFCGNRFMSGGLGFMCALFSVGWFVASWGTVASTSFDLFWYLSNRLVSAFACRNIIEGEIPVNVL